MRRNKIELYIHLVWATWDRQPLIIPAVERRLLRVIEAEAKGMGCDVLALNGMPDHDHALLSIPTTITIADLVKQLKGVSSQFFNHELLPSVPFKWQGCYGAFSISRSDIDEVIHYIKFQKQRHDENLLRVDLESCFEEDE